MHQIGEEHKPGDGYAGLALTLLLVVGMFTWPFFSGSWVANPIAAFVKGAGEFGAFGFLAFISLASSGGMSGGGGVRYSIRVSSHMPNAHLMCNTAEGSPRRAVHQCHMLFAYEA